jgi:hypothetical protein
VTVVPVATHNTGAAACFTDTFGICDDLLLDKVTLQLLPALHVAVHAAAVSEQGSGVLSALAEIPITESAIGTSIKTLTLHRFFIIRPFTRLLDHIKLLCDAELFT